MVALAVMTALAAGCMSANVGNRNLVRTGQAPGLDTKAAVFNALGCPSAIHSIDDGQILIYVNSIAHGGALALQYDGVGFGISRSNWRGDVVIFNIAPNGHVRNVRVLANADKAGYSCWPF